MNSIGFMLRMGRQAPILAFSGLLSLVCGSGAQAMPITLEGLVGKLVVGHAGDSVTVETKYQDKTPFDMEYVGIKVITNEGGLADEPYVSMDIRCDPRTKTCSGFVLPATEEIWQRVIEGDKEYDEPEELTGWSWEGREDLSP